ncbi:urease accessory protein ureD [Stutzerimonas stutzeri]|uniref:Urease accessory protein UreD n=1 Tax=Stutzerimonas stutzeri TaxID=316 RepID=A0A2N8SXD7_STUST|nr:urease accessory protein UreD [Stutzerimonas stutzeri]MCQ4327109.1 urease accessory protein UreD [Stutzerimonas stutzeri]PNG07138.1 urease accessory protein ureD [Stutzerimonas stutzeri]
MMTSALWSCESSEQARLSFARAPDGTSYIARQQVGYPFHLGRNLRLPGDPPGMAAAYLQSCSGGVFAGEDLGLLLHAGAGAQAHLSTGAATIAHAMRERPARQRVRLEAESGALLEYLPLATILFPGARLHSRIEAVLHPGARMLLSDAFCAHAPEGEGGVFGWYRADLDVRTVDGRLLAADRLYVEGADFQRGLPGISDGVRVLGTFLSLGEGPPPCAALRAALEGIDGLYAGVSVLPGDCGAMVRLAAVGAPELRRGLHAAWAAMRLEFTGRAPAMRRR